MSGQYDSVEIAECYDKNILSYPPAMTKRILEYLRALNPGMKSDSKFDLMLDAGCGNGISTRIFGPYFKSIVGFDISEAQLEKAKEHDDDANIIYCVGSGESMPAEDRTVNLVTSGWSFQYMDVNKFVDECNRVLKDTGCAAIYAYEFVDLNMNPTFPNQGNQKCAKNILHDVLFGPLKQHLIRSNDVDRCTFDRFNDIYNRITGIRKERNDQADDIVFCVKITLEEFVSFILCIPCFREFFESSEGRKVIPEFRRKLKELWNAGNKKDDDLHMVLTLSMFFIFLRPHCGE